ncbi:hypothetical protein AB0I51_22530 [Streptomyces sp. NPDC050549]|uniref:hypothetical protein n=1 Tax=Streptomyces sp. NPDC050549 TaxID=3155406 RepID=UPI00341C6C67
MPRDPISLRSDQVRQLELRTLDRYRMFDTGDAEAVAVTADADLSRGGRPEHEAGDGTRDHEPTHNNGAGEREDDNSRNEDTQANACRCRVRVTLCSAEVSSLPHRLQVNDRRAAGSPPSGRTISHGNRA